MYGYVLYEYFPKEYFVRVSASRLGKQNKTYFDKNPFI